MIGPEMRRILSLPRAVEAPPSPLVDKWASNLRPVQIRALNMLAAAPDNVGLYGDIPVGEGKFLIAMLAGAVLGARRALILTDASLVAQAHREIERFRHVFPEVAGHMPTIMSYEALSRPESANELDRLRPTVVACDEAHRLCHKRSARTQRVLRFAVHNPETRWVILSGSLQRRTLGEIAHLAEMALRDGTWLPLDPDVLDTWSAVLDNNSRPSKEQRAAMQPLIDWAGADDVEAAYRERFTTTQGVLSVHSSGPSAALRVGRLRLDPPNVLKTAVRELQSAWTLPDGNEIVDVVEYLRHNQTLALGFYYKLNYPEGPLTAQWQDARRTWGRELRLQIQYRPGDLDSPARVERAAQAGIGVPKSLIAAYNNWVAVRDLIEPEREVVWLTQDVVDAAVDALNARSRGILWYASSTALEPALRARGVQVFGGGSDAPPDDVPRVALSSHAHGTGKNLQAWAWQLVIEPSGSASWWQQLLGRTHREGQRSDEVIAEVLCTTWFQRAQLFAAKQESAVLEKKYGAPFRLTHCDWLGDRLLLTTPKT